MRRATILALALLVAVPPALLGYWRFVPPSGSALMMLRGDADSQAAHRWVPLSAISINLRRAVLASEDAAFCGHGGFDWQQIQAAWADYQDGGRLRGASTISMQTVKNLMLWPGRDWLRKGLEAYFTIWIEALWPKRRILEAYLNIAEWDRGIYGAEAAARHHFRRAAKRLTVGQAARLAAVLPNPRVFSARRPNSHVRQRAATIRARMAVLGPADDCVQ